MATMLGRCQKKHLARTYGVSNLEIEDEFLETLARKSGRLLKGGEPDFNGVARMVLNDFLRGKIPWHMPPPKIDTETDVVDGREGRLGEMTGMKRKRDADDVGDDAEGPSAETEGNPNDDAGAEEDDSFEGFGHDESDEEQDEAEDEDEVNHDQEDEDDDGSGSGG